MESSVHYSDKILNTNLSFLERKNNQLRRSLGLEGTLPIDLSFFAEERIDENREIDLTFIADNFDLRFASSFIPGVKNLVGFLNGKVNIDGYYDDINNCGELTIDNSSFVLELTNLTYLLNAKLDFQNDKIILSSMNLSNDRKIKNGWNDGCLRSN